MKPVGTLNWLRRGRRGRNPLDSGPRQQSQCAGFVSTKPCVHCVRGLSRLSAYCVDRASIEVSRDRVRGINEAEA